jgi:hypothetical protein
LVGTRCLERRLAVHATQRRTGLLAQLVAPAMSAAWSWQGTALVTEVAPSSPVETKVMRTVPAARDREMVDLVTLEPPHISRRHPSPDSVASEPLMHSGNDDVHSLIVTHTGA